MHLLINMYADALVLSEVPALVLINSVIQHAIR